MLERRYVEITDEDRALGGTGPQVRGAHFVKEFELMGEFRVDSRIRFVAARRNVKIMHRHGIREAGARTETDRHMAAVGLAAIAADIDRNRTAGATAPRRRDSLSDR